MFEVACGMKESGGWGILPTEFWKMTPFEWWRLYDMNVGYRLKDKRDTMDRMKRLYFDAKGKS